MVYKAKDYKKMIDRYDNELRKERIRNKYETMAIGVCAGFIIGYVVIGGIV